MVPGPAREVSAPPPTGFRLEHLLEAVEKDPSLLLAREFTSQAWTAIESGDDDVARRSVAAARIALRLGGHDTVARRGVPSLGPPNRAFPEQDPPAPPSVVRPRG